MAKTYDTYQKLKGEDRTMSRPTRKESIEARIEAAVEQTELLQDVGRRVKHFIEAYERCMDMELKHIAEARLAEDWNPDSFKGKIVRNMEDDLQLLRSATDSPENARLHLDDLKILLDQFPQQLDIRI